MCSSHSENSSVKRDSQVTHSDSHCKFCLLGSSSNLSAALFYISWAAYSQPCTYPQGILSDLDRVYTQNPDSSSLSVLSGTPLQFSHRGAPSSGLVLRGIKTVGFLLEL